MSTLKFDTSTFLRKIMTLSLILILFSTKHPPKMWLPWQQGNAYFRTLISKHHLYIFRRSHKVSRKHRMSFQIADKLPSETKLDLGGNQLNQKLHLLTFSKKTADNQQNFSQIIHTQPRMRGLQVLPPKSPLGCVTLISLRLRHLFSSS